MRFTARYAVWLLLPIFVGCDHKVQSAPQQTLAPPIVDAPPPKPATVSKADLPPVVIGDAPPAKPAQETPPETPAKKPVHRAKKPVTPPATPAASPAPPAATTAEATPPPSVSAVGELSGGASGNVHSQTEDLINATEKGVNAITRPLSDSEAKTAAHIREFLKQAREALTTGDTDGAKTLAMKAKVLLAELNQ